MLDFTEIDIWALFYAICCTCWYFLFAAVWKSSWVFHLLNNVQFELVTNSKQHLLLNMHQFSMLFISYESEAFNWSIRLGSTSIDCLSDWVLLSRFILLQSDPISFTRNEASFKRESLYSSAVFEETFPLIIHKYSHFYNGRAARWKRCCWLLLNVNIVPWSKWILINKF